MKIKYLISMLLAGCFALAWADGLTDMRGLALQNVKIPYYKENKLQLVAFSKTGTRQDRLMLGSDTLLDILLDDADIDTIADGWGTRLYPLNSPLKTVLDFWQKRYRTSNAVIFTNRCSIDQERGEAFGDDPVFMRSPMLDMDGIGFQANFKQNVIEVISEVNICARQSNADPRKLLNGTPLPQSYQVITASSDSLRMDMDNNEIMLIGNVKVIDGQNVITCDRLTVFLTDKDIAPNTAEPVLKGVSRVLADGDVVLARKPSTPAGTPQFARSERLEYEPETGIIALSCDDKDVELQQGDNEKLFGKRIELLRHKETMFVHGSCRVISQKRSPDGKVISTRTITSQRADFDNRSRLNNFHGDVVAVDGDTTLKCDRLRIYTAPKGSGQDVEKILAENNVRLISISQKAPKNTTSNTLTSRNAEFNYQENKLIFTGDVKVKDDVSTLDCDRLDLFLADKKKSRQPVSGSPLGASMGGNSKTLTKIIAAGRVFMKNGNDDMQTELMTLFFRDLPADVKPSPGMFQSGGVQLIKIVCDGSVTATSSGKTGKKVLKAQHAMSDLLKEYSEFNEKVVFSHDNNEIFCRDMYIFTGEALPESAKKAVELAKANDVDTDPFSLDMGENSVPSRIAVSDGIDLKRIVCKNDVILLKRSDNGKIQRAGGDMAVYTVEKQEMVLTAQPPNRPWLKSDGRIQYCDLIRGDMASEELRGIGNVRVMPDTGK